MTQYVATINKDGEMLIGVFSTLELAKVACGSVNWRTNGRLSALGAREWEGHQPVYGHCQILEIEIDHKYYPA